MSNTPPRGYKVLPGSERQPLAEARPAGPIDPNEHIEVSVYLRAPASSNLSEVVRKSHRLTREQYAKEHGASPEDIAKVEQFARDHDLTIVEEHPTARKVVLAGTAAAINSAFATELRHYDTPSGSFRGRTGPVHIPTEMDQIIVGVLGLDNRPQASPHLRRSQPKAEGTTLSYTPSQLAQLYNFPTDVDGADQCVAIIELGGGFRRGDLGTYFQQLNISPQPGVTSVSVDRGGNHPFGNPDANCEVDLDIEVVGAIAPSAHVAVYFAPNTDQGFLDAITQAIHDKTNNPSVISISWGSAEVGWTAQAMHLMDQAFQTAAALGITVCCAAGDNGSSDGVNDGKNHVDFPASSPYALSCGGTRLEAANGQITCEVVWNEAADSATGGGVSDVFDLPTWQANLTVLLANGSKVALTKRGVPDVAGDADPQTGYQVRVDGQDTVIGGTSAVAPLWAGLIALMNQKLGHSVGYLNPTLYKNYAQLIQANALQDITDGNNGAYAAGPGWDACTGLGSPNGTNLLKVLSSIVSSAVPAVRNSTPVMRG